MKTEKNYAILFAICYVFLSVSSIFPAETADRNPNIESVDHAPVFIAQSGDGNKPSSTDIDDKYERIKRTLETVEEQAFWLSQWGGQKYDSGVKDDKGQSKDVKPEIVYLREQQMRRLAPLEEEKSLFGAIKDLLPTSVKGINLNPTEWSKGAQWTAGILGAVGGVALLETGIGVAGGVIPFVSGVFNAFDKVMKAGTQGLEKAGVVHDYLFDEKGKMYRTIAGQMATLMPEGLKMSVASSFDRMMGSTFGDALKLVPYLFLQENPKQFLNKVKGDIDSFWSVAGRDFDQNYFEKVIRLAYSGYIFLYVSRGGGNFSGTLADQFRDDDTRQEALTSLELMASGRDAKAKYLKTKYETVSNFSEQRDIWAQEVLDAVIKRLDPFEAKIVKDKEQELVTFLGRTVALFMNNLNEFSFTEAELRAQGLDETLRILPEDLKSAQVMTEKCVRIFKNRFTRDKLFSVMPSWNRVEKFEQERLDAEFDNQDKELKFELVGEGLLGFGWVKKSYDNREVFALLELENTFYEARKNGKFAQEKDSFVNDVKIYSARLGTCKKFLGESAFDSLIIQISLFCMIKDVSDAELNNAIKDLKKDPAIGCRYMEYRFREHMALVHIRRIMDEKMEIKINRDANKNMLEDAWAEDTREIWDDVKEEMKRRAEHSFYMESDIGSDFLDESYTRIHNKIGGLFSIENLKRLGFPVQDRKKMIEEIAVFLGGVRVPAEGLLERVLSGDGEDVQKAEMKNKMKHWIWEERYAMSFDKGAEDAREKTFGFLVDLVVSGKGTLDAYKSQLQSVRGDIDNFNKIILSESDYEKKRINDSLNDAISALKKHTDVVDILGKKSKQSAVFDWYAQLKSVFEKDLKRLNEEEAVLKKEGLAIKKNYKELRLAYLRGLREVIDNEQMLLVGYERLKELKEELQDLDKRITEAEKGGTGDAQ